MNFNVELVAAMAMFAFRDFGHSGPEQHDAVGFGCELRREAQHCRIGWVCRWATLSCCCWWAQAWKVC
jgi:hypothetical protein